MVVRMDGEEPRFSPTPLLSLCRHPPPPPEKAERRPHPEPSPPKGQLPEATLGEKTQHSQGQRTETPGRGTEHRYSKAQRSREEELEGLLARTANASRCPSSPGCRQPPPPARTHPPPNSAWETGPPVGSNCSNPESNKISKMPPPAVAPTAWISKQDGQSGERQARVEQGPGTIHHGGSQETGHTVVTCPNLGISALCPEPSSTPHPLPPQ